MSGRIRLLAVGMVLLALAACGGDGDLDELEGLDDFPEEDSGSSDSGDGGLLDLSEDRDTGVVVTVDGAEYRVDTQLGGSCRTEYDPDRQDDLSASGYDVETGTRVELGFSRQAAEFSPSGEDEYYGRLFIASSPTSWQIQTQEPWEWIDGDRSTVAGSVTMEDDEGGTADITFEVTCP